MAEKGTSVEQLFLDNVNVEQVFNLMDRIDYLFLRYIRDKAANSETGGVYLAELAEGLQMPMPSVSREISKLQERGYIKWLMGEERNRTYVELTQKAVDRLEQQRQYLREVYEKITEELGEEETAAFVKSLHRVAEIVKKETKETE
ncbi:MAG: winged helix-turn-helix transcriptional regulator [Lachnospiraceae bacterium]|nr:winged helix-turn-helix transcriptional regulator [Lachnospiraceae bacterium]